MELALENVNNIYKMLSREHDYSVLLSSNKSDFTTQFHCPLILKGDRWTVGLVSLETYNSIPNITEKNNVFTYSTDSGVTWKTITLPIGSYEIQEIDSEIDRLMRLNKDKGIDIKVNNHTLGSVVHIRPETYEIDFTVENSIGIILGFDSVVLKHGYNISPSIVKILSVNSILVNCDIVSNSYLNSSNYPVLYSFFPNSKPGYKIIQDPVNVVYLPINTEHIQNIRIWLTDQDGNALDFRGETITCRLNFKQI